jgi:chitin disaccharide deacetylase
MFGVRLKRTARTRAYKSKSCMQKTDRVTPKLIVNADDFGASSAINRAVIRAHREGVLTSCSIMTGGDAFDEAVALARAHPSLAVGLHLTLVCGRASAPPSRVESIADAEGLFSNNPFLAGVKYFLLPKAKRELRGEIYAQFERFAATGLSFSHVDGHLHFHLHPTAFDILIEAAEKFGVRRIRIPRESLSRALAISRAHFVRKALHWATFGALSRRAIRRLRHRNFFFTDEVYGLLETGGVHEEYWLKLLPRLEAETCEIYCHPEIPSMSSPPFNLGGDREFEALISENVRRELSRRGIGLSTYADLS